jgi:hypothetical protein
MPHAQNMIIKIDNQHGRSAANTTSEFTRVFEALNQDQEADLVVPVLVSN